jgi:hypothetical protein
MSRSSDAEIIKVVTRIAQTFVRRSDVDEVAVSRGRHSGTIYITPTANGRPPGIHLATYRRDVRILDIIDDLESDDA